MPDQKNRNATPDEKIAHQAREWRACEKVSIGAKTDQTKKATYHALQKLREVVDTAGSR